MHSSISKKSGKDEIEYIYVVLYCLTTNKNWSVDKERVGGTKESNIIRLWHIVLALFWA